MSLSVQELLNVLTDFSGSSHLHSSGPLYFVLCIDWLAACESWLSTTEHHHSLAHHPYDRVDHASRSHTQHTSLRAQSPRIHRTSCNTGPVHKFLWYRRSVKWLSRYQVERWRVPRFMGVLYYLFASDWRAAYLLCFLGVSMISHEIPLLFTLTVAEIIRTSPAFRLLRVCCHGPDHTHLEVSTDLTQKKKNDYIRPCFFTAYELHLSLVHEEHRPSDLHSGVHGHPPLPVRGLCFLQGL